MFQPKTVLRALAMLLALAPLMASIGVTQAVSVSIPVAAGDSLRVGTVDQGTDLTDAVKIATGSPTVFEGVRHGNPDAREVTSINPGPGKGPVSGQVSTVRFPYTAAAGLPPSSIRPGAKWHYFKGTAEPPKSWKSVGFDDASWGVGPAGIGYGDGDDATVLDDMKDSYVSVYLRKTFRVPDPSAVSSMQLSLDYDDGFVAYLNGKEVARSNIKGTPPAHDTLATASHEASGGNTTVHPVEKIDISSSVSLLLAGENVLALQGHNVSLSSSDLSLIPSLSLNTSDSTDPPEPVDPPASADPPESALVGRWRFDEGSGKNARDASGKGNTGSLKNGPVWTDGKFGKALEFNASKRQSVVVKNAKELNFSRGSFSIAFWINYKKQNDADIVRKGSTGTANSWYKIELPSDTQKLAFNVHTGTSHIAKSPKRYDDGRWHHVVAIRDVSGGRIRLYVDGTQVASASNPSGSVSNSADLTFGSKDTRDSDFFKGKLDNVEMYRRALSSSEVKAMYSGG